MARHNPHLRLSRPLRTSAFLWTQGELNRVVWVHAHLLALPIKRKQNVVDFESALLAPNDGVKANQQ